VPAIRDETAHGARGHPDVGRGGGPDVELIRGTDGARTGARAARGGERNGDPDDDFAHAVLSPAAQDTPGRTAAPPPDGSDQAAPTGGISSRSPSRAGMQNEIRVPPPGRGSDHITPPCSTTIWRARCRPTPTPAFSLRRVASPVE